MHFLPASHDGGAATWCTNVGGKAVILRNYVVGLHVFVLLFWDCPGLLGSAWVFDNQALD